MAVQWGILTTNKTALTALGRLQKVSVKKTANKADALGPDGNVTDTQFYGESHELTAEIVLDATATEPGIGDDITVDSVTYKITESEKVEENEAFMTYSITAVYDVP